MWVRFKCCVTQTSQMASPLFHAPPTLEMGQSFVMQNPPRGRAEFNFPMNGISFHLFTKKNLIYECLQTLNAKNAMHYLLQLGQNCFSLKLLLNNILIKITVSGRVMHPKPKSHPKFDSGRKAKKIIPTSIQSIYSQNPTLVVVDQSGD